MWNFKCMLKSVFVYNIFTVSRRSLFNPTEKTHKRSMWFEASKQRRYYCKFYLVKIRK